MFFKRTLPIDDNETGNGILKLNPKRILSTTNPLVRVCEQGSHIQALLILAHIISEYEVAGCVSWLSLVASQAAQP